MPTFDSSATVRGIKQEAAITSFFNIDTHGSQAGSPLLCGPANDAFCACRATRASNLSQMTIALNTWQSGQPLFWTKWSIMHTGPSSLRLMTCLILLQICTELVRTHETVRCWFLSGPKENLTHPVLLQTRLLRRWPRSGRFQRHHRRTAQNLLASMPPSKPASTSGLSSIRSSRSIIRYLTYNILIPRNGNIYSAVMTLTAPVTLSPSYLYPYSRTFQPLISLGNGLKIKVQKYNCWVRSCGWESLSQRFAVIPQVHWCLHLAGYPTHY